MANYPAKIWLITPEEFEAFTFTGGKVVYVVEEPDPMFATHPAIITAGALLPPIEAIQCELDGSMFESNMLYEQYLQREEADPYVAILLAAALKQIPVAIMFGKDEMNMQFPKMFIDFLYRYYGLVLGIAGATPDAAIEPYILESCVAVDLGKNYQVNIIDYPSFMVMHPDMPIHQMAISKLAYENNPVVETRDMPHYLEYFESMRKAILNNGRRFLIDPLVAST